VEAEIVAERPKRRPATARRRSYEDDDDDDDRPVFRPKRRRDIEPAKLIAILIAAVVVLAGAGLFVFVVLTIWKSSGDGKSTAQANTPSATVPASQPASAPAPAPTPVSEPRPASSPADPPANEPNRQMPGYQSPYGGQQYGQQNGGQQQDRRMPYGSSPYQPPSGGQQRPPYQQSPYQQRAGGSPFGRPPENPASQPPAPPGTVRVAIGTGFVVAPGGYILTNAHVVRSGRDPLLYSDTVKDVIPAQIIAQDETRDIALLKATIPAGVRLKPIPLASRKLGRGEQVAALGYPLGPALGTGLKMTTGVISAIPEPANEDMLMLDARINPGNSGGPVCDVHGSVIGMVTQKTVSNGRLDSYGMAIPASDLMRFIRRTLKGFKPLTEDSAKKQWDEVDRQVSASVFMIIQPQ
jgi:S1-C subfamily serine protease